MAVSVRRRSQAGSSRSIPSLGNLSPFRNLPWTRLPHTALLLWAHSQLVGIPRPNSFDKEESRFVGCSTKRSRDKATHQMYSRIDQ